MSSAAVSRIFDRDFIALGDVTPGMRVLEIGCGKGALLRHLRSRGFTQLTAVDRDVTLAGALQDLPEVLVHFEEASAYLARQFEPVFDRVAMLDVAEHIPAAEVLALMSAVRRVLHPAGRLVMRVPNAASPWGLGLQFASFDHVTAFTPARMAELAKAAGFNLVRVAGSDGGRGLRRLLQAGVHRLLDVCLVAPPPVWETSLVAVFERPCCGSDAFCPTVAATRAVR